MERIECSKFQIFIVKSFSIQISIKLMTAYKRLKIELNFYIYKLSIGFVSIKYL